MVSPLEFSIDGGPCGVVPEAALQNLIPYGGLVKNFKFLKEVKILSNFVRINLHAQCKFMSAEGTPRKVRRLKL